VASYLLSQSVSQSVSPNALKEIFAPERAVVTAIGRFVDMEARASLGRPGLFCVFGGALNKYRSERRYPGDERFHRNNGATKMPKGRQDV
jgi:hypothetical protein